MSTKPSAPTLVFQRWLNARPALDRIEFADVVGDTMAGPVVIVTRTKGRK